MSQGLSPALLFFLFAAISFLVLRLVIDRLARAKKPILAGPVLAVFGAFSGAYFHKFAIPSAASVACFMRPSSAPETCSAT